MRLTYEPHAPEALIMVGRAAGPVSGQTGRRRNRREQVWVPAPLRGVMSVLRHLPRPVFRRLPV